MSKARSAIEGENTVLHHSAGLRFCVFGQHGLQAAGGCLESGARGSARRERPRSLSRGAGFKRARGEKKGVELAAAELGSCFKQSASAASGAASG